MGSIGRDYDYGSILRTPHTIQSKEITNLDEFAARMLPDEYSIDPIYSGLPISSWALVDPASDGGPLLPPVHVHVPDPVGIHARDPVGLPVAEHA